jgi:hypothetical protein
VSELNPVIDVQRLKLDEIKFPKIEKIPYKTPSQIEFLAK